MESEKKVNGSSSEVTRLDWMEFVSGSTDLVLKEEKTRRAKAMESPLEGIDSHPNMGMSLMAFSV